MWEDCSPALSDLSSVGGDVLSAPALVSFAAAAACPAVFPTQLCLLQRFPLDFPLLRTLSEAVFLVKRLIPGGEKKGLT